ncbi:hypothetical protein DRN67_03735 [Candidatus Micrarchaeota archaeon]|nr:MAG: hypothetical protein DRN67_03735 [Candidatus Micrarchaeota archaeon]
MDTIIILGLVLITTALLFGCAGDGTVPDEACTYEEAEAAALEFLKSDETYAFDGIESSLKLESGEPMPHLNNAWTFTYSFDSAHAGYGDRTGQMLAQVITPHTARITVVGCVVESATLDGSWNMIAEESEEAEEVPADEPETIEVSAGEEFVITLFSNPTTGYDWAPVIEDETVVEYMGSECVGCDEEEMVGAGHDFNYKFKALAEGTTTITMNYERSWEDVPPINTTEFEVVVSS